MYYKGLLLFVCLIANSVSFAVEPIQIKHYQKQARYSYGAELLALALSKLDQPYEILSPEKQDMNEGRGELEVISGNLDLQWLSTNYEREQKMIPIKIPIYRGILGLRLLLVRQDHMSEMSAIQSLEDLQKYKGVHGSHWGDLPVYAANNLPVHTHVKYENLFTLLEYGRVNYFHRGLNEIWDELDRYQNTLSIADNVMLYYPHPVYYFVSKSRPELAQQLEKGLGIAMEDGSFKELFMEFHQDFISRGELESRKLIKLHNPDLPHDTPPIDTEWWLNQTL